MVWLYAFCFLGVLTLLSCSGTNTGYSRGMRVDISKYKGNTIGEFLSDVGMPYDSFNYLYPIRPDTVMDCIFFYPSDIYIRMSTIYGHGLEIEPGSNPDTWDIEEYKRLPIGCIEIDALCNQGPYSPWYY